MAILFALRFTQVFYFILGCKQAFKWPLQEKMKKNGMFFWKKMKKMAKNGDFVKKLAETLNDSITKNVKICEYVKEETNAYFKDTVLPY